MIDGGAMLSFLEARRSVRRFADRPLEHAQLERLLRAATSAPSSTNRQPWRFCVVTDGAVRAEIAAAVRASTARLQDVIARGHHAEEFGNYGDFFFEPLEGAAALIVPQYRSYPDPLAGFLRSGGADPERFETPAALDPERCATSAAVMLLLLQARAEGLGACWMAGPMVARSRVEQLLSIVPPYHMLGVVALGHPAESPAPTPRRSLERVVRWFPDPQSKQEPEHD